MSLKVAYQGVSGAYSEEALYTHFARDFGRENIQAQGFHFSEQVFEAVEQGEAKFGFVPVENSIMGNVDINTDLLYKHELPIFSEYFHPIQHGLLARPGVKIKDVNLVRSHPVALEQCRDFLSRHRLQSIPDYDTAGSAKRLSQKDSQEEAVIASKLCQEIYGLDILESHIQSVQTNITRFLAFSQKDNLPTDIAQEKTSLAFATKHHPGALLNCLQKFANNSINLTKLESRPIPENPFRYIFFVDFVGGQNETNVQNCLEEMKADADSVKILGSYPKGDPSPHISQK